MYLPLSRDRRPTNRQCRIASVESIIGFIGVIWLLLQMPGNFLAFSMSLAAILLLVGHGGWTLSRARPNQSVLWPRFRSRMGFGRRDPPLDEREVDVRHRVFLRSYQLLGLIILAAVLLLSQSRVLFGQLIGTGPDKWVRLHDLTLELLCLLVLLSVLLPNWVLPWLEREISLADEPDSDSSSTSQEGPITAAVDLYPRWIRVLGSPWVVWVLIVIVLLWLFRKQLPGGW